MTPRLFARHALHRLQLPVPERSRTLNVVLTNGPTPDGPAGRCLCSLVATYAWRAAHENRCDRIRVHQTPSHKHEFDTIDLVKHIVRDRLGFWPRPARVQGLVPRWLATHGHRALGNTFDETRPTFHVPVAVSSDAGGRESTPWRATTTSS